MNVDFTQSRSLGGIPHVSDNPDDSHEFTVPVKIRVVNASPDGILSGPHRIGDGFADHCDLGSRGAVGLIKNASTTNRNVHRLEVTWRSDVINGPVGAAVAPAFNAKSSVGAASIKRQLFRSAGRDDTWDRRDPLKDLLVSIGITLPDFRIVLARQQNIDGNAAFGFKSQFDLQHTEKASPKESRSRQQHYRQCDLTDQKDPPGAARRT